MADRKFVAPEGGKGRRFSTGQKVFMVLGLVVIALGIASSLMGLVH